MLFMSDPVDFILMFVAVAVIVGGGIWFLRSQINKGQIATLKERVNLAKEEQVEKQVEALKRETASQQAVIKELNGDITPATLYNLSASSMRIVRTVSAVSNTTASIGTLQLVEASWWNRTTENKAVMLQSAFCIDQRSRLLIRERL
jgi:hypothetical protein